MTSIRIVPNKAVMTAIGRAELERELQELHMRGDLTGAATLALRGYGPEVMGLLLSVLRNEDAAAEVYSEFSASLWAGLAKFRWHSSFRTWAYAIARNAACRYRRDPMRRKALSCSDSELLDDLPVVARTTTATFQRTESRDSVSAVRRGLAEDDQMLLILRVDRALAWNEIATIMSDDEASADETARKRAAAALRKRFERIVAEIRTVVRPGPSAAL